MLSQRKWSSGSVAESREIGARLATDLLARGGDEILLLEGEMGAGKTELVKGLGVALGIDESEIQSPSYALIHEHRGSRGCLVHIDLYRLEPDELDGLGLEEILGGHGIKAIEWWMKLGARPAGSVLVRIEGAGDGDRMITIEG